MKDDSPVAEAAKVNPEARFDAPMDVVGDAGLSLQEKLEILRSWELDAQVLQTAEEENMAGGEPNRLGEVRSAIDTLTATGGNRTETA